MDTSNRMIMLINDKGVIVSNMKDRKVMWVQIYDDWTNGWTPIIMEEKDDDTRKRAS